MSFFTNIYNYLDRFSNSVRLVYKVFIFIGILFYFIYQALTGANGYKSYLIIKQQVTNEQKKLDILKTQLEEIKQKVDLLSSNSLDLDILEERCRTMLNYSYKNDMARR